MSKTNSETMQPETETAAELKLDVSVRPISPAGNLLGYANVTINDSFVVEGFRICSGEKGLYVNMPSTQDTATALRSRRCRQCLTHPGASQKSPLFLTP